MTAPLRSLLNADGRLDEVRARKSDNLLSRTETRQCSCEAPPGSSSPDGDYPLLGATQRCLFTENEAHEARESALAEPDMTISVSSCLGRTCMKWGSDGELTELDMKLVMERLAQVDQDVLALRQGTQVSDP